MLNPCSSKRNVLRFCFSTVLKGDTHDFSECLSCKIKNDNIIIYSSYLKRRKLRIGTIWNFSLSIVRIRSNKSPGKCSSARKWQCIT
jgi:hypothetical protein